MAGRVRVEGVNVAGDDQGDRRVHGGPDKAVYAYASEDVRHWATELDRELPPGTFGENLRTGGRDVTNALVGERWRIGTTLLEVVQPRLPCFKLGLRMGDPSFVRTFGRASRPGAYLRIIDEGELAAYAGEVARVQLSPSQVHWEPQVSYERLVLTISKPGGEVVRQEFAAGQTPVFVQISSMLWIISGLPVWPLWL